MVLRQRSLFPMEIRDHKANSSGLLICNYGVKTETIADTLTQLADLLGGGVSLLVKDPLRRIG